MSNIIVYSFAILGLATFGATLTVGIAIMIVTLRERGAKRKAEEELRKMAGGPK